MPLDAASLPGPASSRTLQRIGAPEVHGWHAKPYVPMADAGGLRPEGLAAAARAFHAGAASPAAAPVAGFALLLAREAAAWHRCVLDADTPSLDAYGAECCT